MQEPTDLITPETVIDENGANVVIFRSWIKDTSNLLTELKQLPWEQGVIVLFGKQCNEGRRTYSCGDDGATYKYSGRQLNHTGWIPSIAEIRDAIHQTFGHYFNSCLLNEYVTGADNIGYHSDKDTTPPLHLVVSVSLGASRDFYFKHKAVGHATIKTVLNDGDMCVMSGRVQELFTHSIPKRAHAGYRISLTFRQAAG